MDENEKYYQLLPKQFIKELEGKIRTLEEQISELVVDLERPLEVCSILLAMQNERIAYSKILTKYYDVIETLSDNSEEE